MPTLPFDIVGKDISGSATFAKVGESLEKLNVQVDRMKGKRVVIDATVNDKGAVAKLKGLEGAADEVGKKTKASGAGLKGMSSGLATLAGSIAVVGAITVGSAVKFDEATDKMAAASNSSVKSAENIGNAFVGIGDKSTFTAIEITEAFTPVNAKLAQVNGHALNVRDSMDFMTAAMDAAESTGGDLNATTAALATVMGAFSIKTYDAGYAADVLSNTSRLTNTPIADLAVGMDKLHAKLGVVAPDLVQTGTLTAALAQHGISGSKGLLTINAAMSTLTSGSKKTVAEVKNLGLKVLDSKGNFVGFGSLIEQLGPKLDKMSTAHRILAERTLFGSGAAGVMDKVISDGPKKFDALAESVGEAGGAHEAAEKATAGLKSQVERLKAGSESLAITFGQKLVPFALQFVNKLKDLAEWGEKNAKWLLPAVGYVGAFAVAVLIITKAMSAWSAIIKITTALQKLLNIEMKANIFGIIVIAIVALVAAFIYFWKTSASFRDFWKGLWADIQAIVKVVVSWFKDTLVPEVESVWHKIQAGFQTFLTVWNKVWSVVSDVVKAFMGWFTANVLPGIKDIFNQASGAISAFGDAAKPVFQFVVFITKWAAGQILDVVVPLFKILSIVAQAFWQLIEPIFIIGWRIIVAVFKGGVAFVEAVWHPLWSGLVTIVKGVWTIISSVISGAFQVIKGIFEVFAGIFTGNWTKVWRGLRDIVDGVGHALGGIVKGFLTIIWGELKVFGAVVYGIFKGILAFLTSIWKDIWSVVGGFAKRIWSDITGFFKRIWQDIKNYINLTAAENKRVWGAIRDFIVDIGKKIWSSITGFFKRLGTDIKNYINDTLTENKKVWGAVLSIITDIGKRIWSGLVATFNKIKTDVVNAVTNLKDGIVKRFTDIKTGFVTIAGAIKDRVVQAFTDMKNGLLAIFKDIANTVFVAPINFVINTVIDKGINSLLAGVGNVFGQHWGVHVNPIQGFAAGGVVPGNGNKDSFMAMLMPGEVVVSKDKVRAAGGPQAFGYGPRANANAQWSGGLPHYGLGDFIGSIGSGIANAAGAVGHAVSGAVGTAVGWARGAIGSTAQGILNSTIYPLADSISKPGLFGQAPHNIAHKIGDSLVAWLKGKDQSTPLPGGSIPTGQHLAIIQAAMKFAGVAGGNWISGLNTLIGRESGWNPNSINLSDINAKHGDPSRGLAQTIMSTFLANHVPGTSGNIFDPVANVAAAIRYILGRYHSIDNVQQANANLPPKGYANGGIFNRPTAGIFGEAGTEVLLPLTRPRRVAQLMKQTGLMPTSSGGDRHYYLTINARTVSTEDLREGFKKLEALDGASA